MLKEQIESKMKRVNQCCCLTAKINANNNAYWAILIKNYL